ncbi:armadillo-type protein [Thelephora terrestris]|uniref:Armadillo-type protein n=1 Tax=Thelephora terrestris TaxID=56493 RepID=A0A9P6HFA6_9AGAM|nr:armadillo-type protein [Thelephora terrestris]
MEDDEAQAMPREYAPEFPSEFHYRPVDDGDCGGGATGERSNQATKDRAVSLKPIAPLEVSPYRWTRRSPVDGELNVERKVTALLNKLTMTNFDSISDQIIEWANESETESDGRTLVHVIRLVYERAIDEARWSEMHARLCRKMMKTISPEVQDDGIRHADGKPIAGGQLFRKYLLNRCQEDFERGWAKKDAAASAAKASEDAAVNLKAAKTSAEAELYSDEYYAAQKAKRQGLGLVQFIGELYKFTNADGACHARMVENPEEDEIESLCRLLATVGRLLDNSKAQAHMDIYFTRMKELSKSNSVVPRMQFMLQDIIELRGRAWIQRHQVVAPTILAQVHKERSQAENEAGNRIYLQPRGGSSRGGGRGRGPARGQQATGWSFAGGSTPRPPTKAGDLSSFGKIDRSGPVVMGPSTVWAGKKDTAKRDATLTRVNSSSNMFSMLGRDAEAIPETGLNPSRSSSRRTSVGFGAAEPQRRNLQLLPRSKPLEEENKANGGSSDHSEDEGGDEILQAMSEDEADKKIAEDIKEFFTVRNIDESEDYFTKLPPEHHHRLVDKIISKAIESKEADGKLVADAFARAAEKKLCSASAFEEGFLPIAEMLDDIAIDAPKAFQIMATMMKGAGLDEEKRTKIAQKSMDSDKLLELLVTNARKVSQNSCHHVMCKVLLSQRGSTGILGWGKVYDAIRNDECRVLRVVVGTGTSPHVDEGTSLGAPWGLELGRVAGTVRSERTVAERIEGTPEAKRPLGPKTLAVPTEQCDHVTSCGDTRD